MDVISTSELVTIGELVRLSNVRYSTLKHYTEEGMLRYEPTEQKLTRRYKRVENLKRLEFIGSLRKEGKSITEIKGMLTETFSVEDA